MSPTRKTLFPALIVAAGVFAATLLPAQVSRIPSVTPDEPTPADDDTRVRMQAKLLHTQQIIQGLVTQDYTMVREAAASLKDISLNPVPKFGETGDETDAQVYEHFRMEFARLAGRLESHAEAERHDATAYVYQNLTDTCIACHDYIRDYPE